MSCLADWQISRLATEDGGAIAGDPHARGCMTCRRKIGEERALRARLQALPAPAVDPDRLRELEAVIVAIAQQRRAPERGARRRWWPIAAVAGSLAAAAAVVAIAVVPARHVDAKLAALDLAAPAGERIAIAERRATMEDPAPLPVLPRGPEVVRLVDGTLELDTRGARPVEVHVGGDVVRVAESKVTIKAHARAIVSVRVLIGAAHVRTGDRAFELQRDIVWEPAPPAAAAAPTTPLAVFADGWLALRDGKNLEAIALFDRAGEIEEAMYWAAIAARRAGLADAEARMAAFVARFPASPLIRR